MLRVAGFDTPVPAVRLRGRVPARPGPGARRRRPRAGLVSARSRSQVSEFRLPDVGEGLTEAEILALAGGARRHRDGQPDAGRDRDGEGGGRAAVAVRRHGGSELLVEPGVTVAVGTPIIAIDDRADAGADRRRRRPPTGADAGRSARRRTAGSRRWSATARDAGAAASGPRRAGGRAPAARPRRSGRRTQTAPRRRRQRAPAALAGTAPAATVPLAKPPVRKLAKDLGIDLRARRRHRRRRRDHPRRRRARRRRPRRAGRAAGTARASAGTRQRRPQGDRRRDGGQRVHRAARHGVPHRRRHGDDGAARAAAAPPASSPTCSSARWRSSPGRSASRLRRTPELNARWDEAAGEIVYYDHVNLGIAAATPRGLIVPDDPRRRHAALPELAGALHELTDHRPGRPHDARPT